MKKGYFMILKQGKVISCCPLCPSCLRVSIFFAVSSCGDHFSVPSTIDDAAILGEIEEAMKDIGYAQKCAV